MKVHQLSVFIENKSGRVSEVASVLSAATINIRGFSVSDMVGYGILRLVVDRSEQGVTVLKKAGFTVKENKVICIKLKDSPGALASVLKIVSDAGVNIEYVYSLISTYIVINVGDVDHALQLLSDQPVQLVSHEEIARIG